MSAARQGQGMERLARFARRFSVPIAILLVLVGLGLRAADLRADPPPDLSWSTGPYTDEALNTYSARNMVLYGTWRVDDFFPFVVYPLVNYLMVLVFKLLGIGFVQVKLLSLLSGTASVFVLYLLVKEDSGPVAGLLAALVLATSFPLAMYSRLGLAESVQILFLLLTGLFYVRGLKKPWQSGLCGFFATCTVLLVKVSAAFVVPALAVAFAWQFRQERENDGRRGILLRGLAFWLAGAAAAAAVWFVAVFFPHRGEYVQYVLRHSLESPAGHPRNVAAYLFNTFTVGLKSHLLPKLPVVALVGFLAFPYLARTQKPGIRFLGLWFVFGLLMLGYMNYRPDRYELVLLPALIGAFAMALASFAETGRVLSKPGPPSANIAGATAWLWPLATQAAIYSNGFWGMARPRTEAGLLAITLAVAAVASLAAFGLGKMRKGKPALPYPAVRIPIVAFLLLLALLLDFRQFSRWYSTRTYELVTIGAELDRALPNDAVLAGIWSPELLLNSRKRALAITDWANCDDPVARFGATHVVSQEGGLDFKVFSERYPAVMRQAAAIRRFTVRGIPLTVYELPTPLR